MKNILRVLLICGLLVQVFCGDVSADQYTGGSGDGWAYAPSESLILGGADLFISSAADQIFNVGQPFKDAQAITITDIGGSGIITASGGLRIIIPDSFGMQWHGVMFGDDSVTDASNANFSIIAAQMP